MSAPPPLPPLTVITRSRDDRSWEAARIPGLPPLAVRVRADLAAPRQQRYAGDSWVILGREIDLDPEAAERVRSDEVRAAARRALGTSGYERIEVARSAEKTDAVALVLSVEAVTIDVGAPRLVPTAVETEGGGYALVVRQRASVTVAAPPVAGLSLADVRRVWDAVHDAVRA